MSDAFSESVALLDGIEHLPVAASESSRLSSKDRAVVTAGILKLVRDGVLPQSDLAHVDLQDAAEVQRLLYRLYAAIAGHLDEAELTSVTASESARGYLIPYGWFG